ncbi:MAG: nuclear transport factor 2 family protein [Streptosporangiaceae bacterium]
MPTEAHMKSVLQAYVDGFAAGDPDAVIALFTEDAVVEDPIGTPELHGREAIAEFYRNAIGSGAKLTLDAPIRASSGAKAAMAFTVEVQGMRIGVVDVMTFNDEGRVVRMEAVWGPEDITT